MSYFSNAKEKEEVFGLIYGKGIIRSVWENSYYSFEVEYNNGQVVPYTEDGYPAWITNKNEFQTVFYAKDIDLQNLDFSCSTKVLDAKKIIKLRNKNKLEVKGPSGIWQSTDKFPDMLQQEYLEDNKLHLFRKVLNE